MLRTYRRAAQGQRAGFVQLTWPKSASETVQESPKPFPGTSRRWSRAAKIDPRAPKSDPRAPKTRPRAPKTRPREAQERPQNAQEPPKSAQKPPKKAPRAVQERHREPKSRFHENLEKPMKTIGFYRFSARLPSLSPGLPNLEKTKKNAVLSSIFEVRAVLHSKRSWTPLGGLLGANLDVLGVHLAASVTNLGPT